MRFVFILAGVGLFERFHWLIYVFGAFLVFTGIKMALPKKEEFEPEKNIVLRLFRRFCPGSPHLRSRAFLYGAPRAARPPRSSSCC
jgi:tellurite resistance protein TerC